MSNNISEKFEELGSNDIEEVELLKTTLAKSLIYDKEIVCPVCDCISKVKVVKTSSYRVGKKHSDLYNEYTSINPYFYDVWLCNACGYASMKSDFEKIKSSQIEVIRNKISLKWHERSYSEFYDVDIAIERFKLALVNSLVMETADSRKGMLCLKIGWMYRIKGNVENERTYISQALECFKNSYFKEAFPIYGMDKFTVIYLIGELFRRIGDFENSLLWLSQVITDLNVSSKIKEMAKDQRDLIKSKSMDGVLVIKN